MQANNPTHRANKPQATTHPHTNNNPKPHIKPPQKCPHTKTDKHGLTNCTKSDSTIGLCQNPCPYGYKATPSASMTNCTTSVDRRVLSRFQRKRREAGFSAAFFEVVQNGIEAAGVDVYA